MRDYGKANLGALFATVLAACSGHQAPSKPKEVALAGFVNGPVSTIFFSEKDKEQLSIASLSPDKSQIGGFTYWVTGGFQNGYLEFKGMTFKSEGHSNPVWTKKLDRPQYAMLILDTTIADAEVIKNINGKIRVNARAIYSYSFDPSALFQPGDSDLWQMLMLVCTSNTPGEGPWSGTALKSEFHEHLWSSTKVEDKSTSLITDEFDPKTCHGDIRLGWMITGFTTITFDRFEVTLLQ